jgi:hypothetical protein
MQIMEGTRKANIVSMIDHMIAFGLWNMVKMFCSILLPVSYSDSSSSFMSDTKALVAWRILLLDSSLLDVVALQGASLVPNNHLMYEWSNICGEHTSCM